MKADSRPGWATDLIGLLDQQRGLYVQLEQLSQQQGVMVRSAEPDLSNLVLLLGQRQNLIDQLTRLGEQMEPYRRDWPALWHSLQSTDRARVEALISDVQSLLDVILDQDETHRGCLMRSADQSTTSWRMQQHNDSPPSSSPDSGGRDRENRFGQWGGRAG